jgi:hypothetical protein
VPECDLQLRDNHAIALGCAFHETYNQDVNRYVEISMHEIPKSDNIDITSNCISLLYCLSTIYLKAINLEQEENLSIIL